MDLPGGQERNSDATSPNQPPSAPPSIPGHEALRLIARGAYGEIWLARSSLGALRAVKVIRRTTFSSDRPYDREYAGLRSFEPISREHPGFVDILHVGRDDDAGFFHYVMELADHAGGGSCEPDRYVPATLDRMVRERGRLPVALVVELGLVLAKALAFLHQRGLVHRDVKPSNIILVAGRPKLADIGLVAERSEARSLVGTDGYIPPEGPGTPAADIYSLGKVLYEAATGRDRHDFPELPTRFGEGEEDTALAELDEVLVKACAPDPRNRYDSAEALAADLEHLRLGRSLRDRRRRRARQRTGAGVAGVILVAGLGYFGLKGTRDAPQVTILLEETFDSADLNTSLWTTNFAQWDGHTNVFARSAKSGPENGELVIRSEANHYEGDTTSQVVYVDLNRDLRVGGPYRLEFSWSGSARGGRFGFCLADGSPPATDFEPGGQRLLELAADHYMIPTAEEEINWPSNRMVVEFWPTTGVALVRTGAAGTEDFRLEVLRPGVPWRPRFWARASCALGQRPAFSEWRIGQLSLALLSEQPVMAGRVVELFSRMPLSNVAVRDRRGRLLARTTPHGYFWLDAGEPWGWAELRFECAGYEPVEEVGIRSSALYQEVSLSKLDPGFGDAVAAVTWDDFAYDAVGFWNQELYLLGPFSLRRLDRDGLRLTDESGARKLEVPHAIRSFAECGRRLLGLSHFPAVLWDLDGDPSKLATLQHPAAGGNKEVQWPTTCAFDGRSLWFAESDMTAQRFGLHEVSLDTLKVVRFLPSTDRLMYGLAWDGERMWISSGSGRVYAVNLDMAGRKGHLGWGIEREFPGAYRALAFDQGFLWGLVEDGRRLCKIKLTP